MNDAVTRRFRDFTSLLLDRRGALVDWPEEAEEGLALLPAQTATALGCLESLPLSFGPGSPLPIGLATDFLDRVAPLLAQEPREACLRMPSLYLKKSDLAGPVARTFTWLNARVRIHQTLPVRVLYDTWFFQAALNSEDRWEDLLRVTVNSRSGAVVSMPDPAEETLLQVEPTASQGAATTLPQAARAATRQVRELCRPFVERMESRLHRDRGRLRSYYHALLKEDNSRRARHGQAVDPEKQNARSQAVQLELRRKLAELEERYAPRLDLLPLAVVRLDCPALEIQCQVLRKASFRTVSLFWNALTKGLEPLRCRLCGGPVFAVAFTDETVEPLCAPCHG